MKQFNSSDEVLDFAIEKEEEATRFYLDIAEHLSGPAMAQVFRDFAQEESRHASKLRRVKDGWVAMASDEKVSDLKIGDYLVETEPKPGMDYQDALTIAMQREKAAFKLYTDLAASTEDAGLRDTFLALANEEAKHKLYLEKEYDDRILVDN